MLYYRESSSHPFGQGSQLESRVSTEVSAAVVSQALWTVTAYCASAEMCTTCLGQWRNVPLCCWFQPSSGQRQSCTWPSSGL